MILKIAGKRTADFRSVSKALSTLSSITIFVMRGASGKDLGLVDWILLSQTRVTTGLGASPRRWRLTLGSAMVSVGSRKIRRPNIFRKLCSGSRIASLAYL